MFKKICKSEACTRWQNKFEHLLCKFSWKPALITRLVVGWVFLQSGWGKLHNLDGVTEFFTSLGIPFASVQAPFVATVETVAGLLLILGFMTRLASIPLIATMVVALITAKISEIHSLSDLFSMSEFLYIILLSWLVYYGSGCVSIDYFCCKRKGPCSTDASPQT